MNLKPITAVTFANWLSWLAWLVLIGGWVAAVVVFFVVGTENCATVKIPAAPDIDVCQESTSQAAILLVIVGFSATVSAIFLLTFRYLIRLLHEIEANTRGGDPKGKRE